MSAPRQAAPPARRCSSRGRQRLAPAGPRAVRAGEAPAAAEPALASLQQHGGVESVAAVARTAWGGRGLVVRGAVPGRAAVASIPLSNTLLITDDALGLSIFGDRHHRRWQDAHGPLPGELLEFLQSDARWDARMAAWLLWLRHHRSLLWREYIASLPEEQEMSCLLNFSADEAHELQLPVLQAEAQVQADWCKHLHAKHFDARKGELAHLQLGASEATSLWALSMVRSRTFSEDAASECVTLMAPWLDMANHHATDTNATFCLSRDNRSFQLRSVRPLAPGEEVLITYGADKPNAELLRDYGFVLPGNPSDRISFSLQGADGELPALNAASLLEAAGFTGDLTAQAIEPLASQQLDGDDGDEQLRCARRAAALLSMPLARPGSAAGGGFLSWFTSPADSWTAAGRPPPQPLQRGQAPAERAAVAELKRRLQHQLAQLPTSIATDEALLRDCTAASAATAAVTTRRGDRVGVNGDGNGDGALGVQQRRRRRLQADAAERLRAHAAAPAAGLNAARVLTAVRARLEHKLLLNEALSVLADYEAHLAAKFG